jgi:hypothetical protein
MKFSLKLEEAAITAIGIYALSQHALGLTVWIWILLFFLSDIGMLGYLVSTRVGAITYNLFHHKALALVIAAFGYYFQIKVATSIGLLLFTHASFDRVWGYGLKYKDAFKHTHLGML